MTDPDHSHQALTEAVSRMRLEVAPPEDLWARIAAEIDDDRQLAARTAALPRAIKPGTDLWPAIDRGLATRRGGRPSSELSFAVAASVGLFTVAALASLFALQGRRTTDFALDTPVAVAAVISGIGASAGTAASPSERMLRSATASIMQTLAEVRRERRALEQVLETDRGNADLRALWRHAYETELTLASEVGKVFELYERSLGT